MCKYCENAIKISTKKLEKIILIKSPFGDPISEVESINTINGDNIFFNYCPMCGRKIKENV